MDTSSNAASTAHSTTADRNISVALRNRLVSIGSSAGLQVGSTPNWSWLEALDAHRAGTLETILAQDPSNGTLNADFKATSRNGDRMDCVVLRPMRALSQLPGAQSAEDQNRQLDRDRETFRAEAVAFKHTALAMANAAINEGRGRQASNFGQ